jgi:hypothetical protein
MRTRLSERPRRSCPDSAGSHTRDDGWFAYGDTQDGIGIPSSADQRNVAAAFVRSSEGR